jgi:hypothetical protein
MRFLDYLFMFLWAVLVFVFAVPIAGYAADVPPTITTQPTSADLFVGGNVTLSTAATGTPAPTFQWYEGDRGNTSQPVSGATSPTFVATALERVARYWVRATTPAGMADSQAAVITPWNTREPFRVLAQVISVNGQLVGVSGDDVRTSSDGGVTWAVRVATGNPFLIAELSGIAYGAGAYVVCGKRGIFSSTDLQTWTKRTMPGLSLSDDTNAVSVTYTAGKFWVSAQASVYSSSDGTNWTRVNIGAGVFFVRAIASDGSRLVAVGQDGVNSYAGVVTSVDGTTWTKCNLGIDPLIYVQSNVGTDLKAVTFAAGRFVAVAAGGNIFSSPNGTSWSRTTLSSPTWGANFETVAYGGGIFIAGQPLVPDYATSADGVNWILRAGKPRLGTGWITYHDGRFLAGKYSDYVHSSSDGVNWTEISGSPGDVASVAAGNGLYAVSGDYVVRGRQAYSSDGVSWHTATTPAAGPIGFANGLFLTSDNQNAGRIYTSSDASNWVMHTVSGATESFSRFAAGNGVYVMLGLSSVAISQDGVNWIARSIGIPNSAFHGLTFSQGLFVAVGDFAQIATSPDGATWTLRRGETAPPYSALWGVTFGNGRFVAVGTGNSPQLVTSTDGIIWITRTAPAGFSSIVDIAFGGGRFAALALNTILVSDDGINWRTTGVTINSANGVGHGLTYGPVGFYGPRVQSVPAAIPPPNITSTLTAPALAGVPFSYLIEADNMPTTYNATGLPPGLSINQATGVITGTPTASGTYNVTLAAANAYGTDTKNLSLTVTIPPPPVIGGTLTLNGQLRFPITYSISASNTPTAYNATGLPPGLSIDTSAGVLTGAPTATGTYGITIAAANYGGTATATLMLTITRAPQDSLLSGTQSDLLLEDSVSGERVIWQMNGTAIAASGDLPTFTSGWHFAGVGDFNSDGRADIVLQNTRSGERVIWLMNGTAITGSLGLPTLPLTWQFACVGDVNNDGKPDIILQNTATNDRIIWLMNGNTITGSVALPTLPRAWQICGILDFTGDGQPDLLIQNTSTGERVIWVLNGQLGIASSLGLPTFYAGWRFAGVGHFTSDNLPNIVLQNAFTGEHVLWSISTTGAIVRSTNLPTLSVAWFFAGPALNRAKPPAMSDFDRDGQSDIVLTNTSSGERVIWAMNGANIAGSMGLPTLPAAWRFAGNADFNGDGMNDLLLENTSTGDRIIWLMNGATVSGSVALPTLPVAWSFAAVSDVNLDGEPDIVLQNQSTGERVIWLMDRTTIASSLGLPTLPTSWQIAAAGSFTADTRANLLLENTTTGDRLFWTLNPDGSIGQSVALPTFLDGWRFVGTGDFFSTTRPHIVLENRTTGDHVIWHMSNTDIASSVGLPTLPMTWILRN